MRQSAVSHRSLYRDDLGLNPLVAVSKFGKFRSLKFAAVHSTEQYLTMDGGGWIGTQRVRILVVIAAQKNAS